MEEVSMTWKIEKKYLPHTLTHVALKRYKSQSFGELMSSGDFF